MGHNKKRRDFLKLMTYATTSLVLPVPLLPFNKALANGHQKILFFLFGEGFPYEITMGDMQNNSITSGFTVPQVISPLAPFKNQMSINIHTCANNRTNHWLMHGAGFATLLGNIPDGLTNGHLAQRQGTTFDWSLGNSAIGTGTRFPVLVAGRKATMHSAIDKNNSAPVYSDPAQLQSLLFPAGQGGGTSTPTAPTNDKKKLKAILDYVRTENANIKRHLASEEQVILDQYESALNSNYDLMPDDTSGGGGGTGGSCGFPLGPMTSQTEEAKLERLVQLSAYAMKCGLTNVVSIGSGTRLDHNSCLPGFSWKPSNFNPHTVNLQQQFQDQNVKFYSRLIRDFIRVQSGGVDTIPSDLTVVFMATNGRSEFINYDLPVSSRFSPGHHHGSRGTWPIVLLSGNSNLKTNNTRYWDQSLAYGGVFSAISHAMGVPMDSFGAYSRGPYAPLLG